MAKTAAQELLPELASSADLDEELAVDEYARQNGLSRNFSFDASSVLSYASKAQLSLTSDQGAALLGNGEGLPALQTLSTASVNEQPTITNASAEYLSNIRSRKPNNHAAAVAFDVSRVERAKLMKVELPLLRSDHGSDCRDLTRLMKSIRTAKLHVNILPLEPLDAVHDEDLEFPRNAYAYRAKLEASARENRLSVPKDTLRYLEKALKPSRSDTGTAEFLQNAWPNRMASRTIELTPPLTPRPEIQEPFLPDPEDCQVPIWSDSSSLLQADLASAEANLRDEDLNESELDEGSASLAELLLSLSPPINTSCVNPTTRAFDGLKVDEPLLPSRSVSSPSHLSIDLQHAASTVKMDNDNIDRAIDPDEETCILCSDEMQREMEVGAADFVRSIEQEQLEIHEAKARVKIPVVDFNIREPQWRTQGADAKAQFQHLKETYQDSTIPQWSMTAEPELWWVPFPKKLGRVDLEVNEGPGNASSAFSYLSSKPTPTSADFVWKQAGVAILRDDNDYDDLISRPIKAPTNSTRDMKTLLRKRKFEYDVSVSTDPPSSDQSSPVQLVKMPRSFSTVTRLQSNPSESLSTLLVGSNDPTATAALLANYVDLHTSKKQKTSKSPFFFQKDATREISDTAFLAITQPENVSSITPASLPRVDPIRILPCPDVDVRSEPLKVIVSLSVPSPIVAHIQALLPDAAMIERDFDSWNYVTWDRSSVSRSPIVSSLAAEADFIISPSTAIFTTTFIKAIQKPPLGHKGKATIREKLEKVAARYERLIVLVSAANRVDSRSPSASECTAYADFSGFIASLDTATQVYFVAGGNDTLCKWIASFIARYSSEAMKVHSLLIDDETTWELLMRRAGLNAYAAQVILAHMKPPNDASHDSLGRYGLTGFINMTKEERILEFSQLMGGDRVLRRVSAALDSGWN